MISGFTIDQLRTTDPDLLRAIIREKAHHTVELPLYAFLFAEKKAPERMGYSLAKLLDIWHERGLPEDKEDIRWCRGLLDLVSQVSTVQGSVLHEGGHVEFSVEEQQTIQRLIETRRSIRIWRQDSVPRDLVRKVIRAGQWAPHSCNLQTLRFAVLEGKEGKALLSSAETGAWQVCIVVGQDMRPYEAFSASLPSYNQDLDCGAGVQNMLLCAHSLGLGAVWCTFGKGQAEHVHRQLQLSRHIRLRTYVAMGWPAQTSLPPGRISTEDAILSWS
jgi:nitroreductase